MTTFNGTATLLGVDSGGGATPTFVGGVLQSHVVAINTPGNAAITISRGALSATSNSFQVRDSFAAWRNQRFSVGELGDPSVSGPGADPGGHSLPNLLRYAFNTGSNPPNRGRLPTFGSELVGGSTYLTISFTRSAMAEDIQYIVEASGNLSNWTPVQTVEPGVPTQVTVRDSVPVAVGVNRYLRVRVVERSSFGGFANSVLNASLRGDPSATNPAADYGSRGVSNFLRYAFNLDFFAPNLGQLPVSSIVALPGGERRLSITFRRLAAAGSNLRYVVQTSPNLVTWTTIDTVFPGMPQTVTVQDIVPLGSSPKYIRVLVQQD
jgi:hypothetical protein